MQDKRILIVAGFFPYPADFGGALDVYGKMSALKKLGYTVDIACTCKTHPLPEHLAEVKEVADRIYIVKRENRLIDMLSFKPLQAVSRKELKNISFEGRYDLAILESENTGIVLDNKTFSAANTVIRVHNNEAEYFMQLASSTRSILKKLYYYADALRLRAYSEKMFAKAFRLWFISTDEMNAYRSSAQYPEKADYLPAPLLQDNVKQDLKSRTVLFIGSLFMPNNINAIDWYLENVHNRIAAEVEGYVFMIVGSTGDADIEQIKKQFSGYRNIDLRTNVPDLTDIYRQAGVFINPMQYGTGVKLKSVNAIANGLPLVSTHIGSEGMGLIEGEMFFGADTPDGFYRAIKHIFTSEKKDVQQIVDNAQAFMAKNDYTAILKQLVTDAIAEEL